MRKVYWTCTRVALSEVVSKSVLWHGKMEKGKNLAVTKKGKERKERRKGTWPWGTLQLLTSSL